MEGFKIGHQEKTGHIKKLHNRILGESLVNICRLPPFASCSDKCGSNITCH